MCIGRRTCGCSNGGMRTKVPSPFIRDLRRSDVVIRVPLLRNEIGGHLRGILYLFSRAGITSGGGIVGISSGRFRNSGSVRCVIHHLRSTTTSPSVECRVGIRSRFFSVLRRGSALVVRLGRLGRGSRVLHGVVGKVRRGNVSLSRVTGVLGGAISRMGRVL